MSSYLAKLVIIVVSVISVITADGDDYVVYVSLYSYSLLCVVLVSY